LYDFALIFFQTVPNHEKIPNPFLYGGEKTLLPLPNPLNAFVDPGFASAVALI